MTRTLNQRLIFWRPAVATLLLHALVVTGMTLNWASRSEITVTPRVQPRHIEARLIDASTLKPKKKPVTARKPASKPQSAPTQPVKTAPEPALSKPEPELKPVFEPSARPSAEEQLALARRELARALDAEDVLLEQANDQDIAQSYVSLISLTVQNHWSRPPSARNGMEAELVIQLIPTGEVVSVTVARSSGQLAFDRSAVNAVQKVGRFPELQKLPSRIFEQSFRQFRLLFKPEDLRY